MANFFNPTEFNADEWVSIAKDAGMNYITITAKHHDGFAMFDSKFTDWDIKDRTVYGQDVLKKLAEACKKGGIGAEIASQVGDRAFDYLDAPIVRIGAKEAPIPFAEPLELAVIPGVEEIVEKGKELLGE